MSNLFYDVQAIDTHGGSLRVWITKNKNTLVSENVENIIIQEKLVQDR